MRKEGSEKGEKVKEKKIEEWQGGNVNLNGGKINEKDANKGIKVAWRVNTDDSRRGENIIFKGAGGLVFGLIYTVDPLPPPPGRYFYISHQLLTNDADKNVECRHSGHHQLGAEISGVLYQGLNVLPAQESASQTDYEPYFTDSKPAVSPMPPPLKPLYSIPQGTAATTNICFLIVTF
jgi:hypothetical protein